MKLIDVYQHDLAKHLLFVLLGERQSHEIISHKTMPTWAQHCVFVDSAPYSAWYVIEADGLAAGACYLTRQREIGVGVLRKHRGQGLASAAVDELMRLHPGRFLANINPANEASIALFRKLGFGSPVQITLEKP